MLCTYLQELCMEYNTLMARRSVCHLLARHKEEKQKQRSITLQAEFMDKMRFLVQADETGSDHRDHACKYGYATCICGSHISSIAAMSTDEMKYEKH